jgi:hypothetical protein
MKQVYKVLGVAANSGEFEGTPYDYTKLNVLMSQASDDGKKLGYASVSMKFGKAVNLEKFKDVKFPADMELDVDMVASGNSVVFTVRSAVPVIPK